MWKILRLLMGLLPPDTPQAPETALISSCCQARRSSPPHVPPVMFGGAAHSRCHGFQDATSQVPLLLLIFCSQPPFAGFS